MGWQSNHGGDVVNEPGPITQVVRAQERIKELEAEQVHLRSRLTQAAKRAIKLEIELYELRVGKQSRGGKD